MFFVRSLICLILCLGLILNGSAPALAASGMPAHAGQGQHGDANQAEPACHEQAATPATDPQHSALAAPGDTQAPAQTGTDCCQSIADCDCSCEQHSAAAICVIEAVIASLGDTPVLLPANAGHPAPSPARSIRPPIA